MEVAGLAGTINILGGIVAMLLAVVMGNMAMTPGPVLLVHEFDPANKLHVFLGTVKRVYALVYRLVVARTGETGPCRVRQGGLLAVRGLGCVGGRDGPARVGEVSRIYNL